MLSEKLPKPPYFSKEKMTEQDWQYYFDCRKKYDIPITWEDNSKLTDQLLEMRQKGTPHEDCIKFIEAHNYAIMPKAALAAKHVYGFKKIAECNLFFAKQEYPDEF